jgi:hypothetical protein
MCGRYSSFVKSAKEIILNVIESYGKKSGISKKELLDLLYPMDQSTIFRNTQKLESEEEIKIIKKGRRTIYIATNKARVGARISGMVCGRNYVNRILGKNGIILSNSKHDYPEEINFTTYKQYFQTNFSRDTRLEEAIFEFSNQLGGYIIYMFIKAMDSDFINKTLEIISENDKKKAKGDRIITEEWLEKVIGFHLIPMLWNFRRCLRAFIYIPEPEEESEKVAYYTLDKQNIEQISKAFANLYPSLYYNLENSVMKGLTAERKGYEQQEHDLVEREAVQKKCKHDFSNSQVYKLRGYKNEKISFRRCSVCGLRDEFIPLFCSFCKNQIELHLINGRPKTLITCGSCKQEFRVVWNQPNFLPRLVKKE